MTTSTLTQNRLTRDELRDDSPSTNIPIFKFNNEKIKALDQQTKITRSYITSAFIVGVPGYCTVQAETVIGNKTIVGVNSTDTISFVDNSSNVFYDTFEFDDYIYLTETTGLKSAYTWELEDEEVLVSDAVFYNSSNKITKATFEIDADDEVDLYVSSNRSSWTQVTNNTITFLTPLESLYYKIEYNDVRVINSTCTENFVGNGTGAMDSTDNTTTYRTDYSTTDNVSQNIRTSSAGTCYFEYSYDKLNYNFNREKSLEFWIYIKDATALAKITSFEIRIGASSYTKAYKYNVGSLTAGTWLKIDAGVIKSLSVVSSTPSPTDVLNFLYFYGTFSGALADGDFIVDLVNTYGASKATINSVKINYERE